MYTTVDSYRVAKVLADQVDIMDGDLPTGISRNVAFQYFAIRVLEELFPDMVGELPNSGYDLQTIFSSYLYEGRKE